MCISCFCKHVILNIIGIYIYEHMAYIYITYVHIHIKRFICRCGGYLYCLSYGMCSRPALPCLTSAFMYMHWVVKFRLMHLRLRGRKKHSPSLFVCGFLWLWDTCPTAELSIYAIMKYLHELPFHTHFTWNKLNGRSWP